MVEIKSEVKLVRGSQALDAALVDEKTLSLLSEDRLYILRALAREPKYPAQLAKELKMQVQTVYYHVRLLADAGLVKLEEFEEKGGAVTKRFRATSDALALVVRESWRPLHEPLSKPPAFLKPFIEGTHLNAKIVLGSPDPHGKYRARGSEFCVAEFAAWLGGFASFSYPLFLLDTELREDAKRGNLILLGGPKVNTLVEEVNPLLPIRFAEKTFSIYSAISKKTYPEGVGFLEIVESPFDKRKKLFVIAGGHHTATRVAVLALLKERKKVEEGNLFDSSVCAKVVQGFDEDGDGIVDAVEILE
jgi:DNA-binding transcriptional ArsR family regulator